jgi:glutathione S-transferase
MQSRPLTLYQLPALWSCFSASSFCAKLEAFLRWQNIPHTTVTVHDMRGAPKGKVPYIEDENGKLGDSTLIIEYLSKKHGLNPDASLTPEQKAIARSMRYLCEESIYWAGVYLRWVDEAGAAIIKKDVFGKAPALVRWLIMPLIFKNIKKQLHMQGMGRHSKEEIIAIACADLKSLSDYLGGKTYFFGDTMTTLDLVVFSIVGNLISVPFNDPVCQQARNTANLVAHAERVRSRCFGQAMAKAA